jgi:hypothetical protein
MLRTIQWPVKKRTYYMPNELTLQRLNVFWGNVKKWYTGNSPKSGRISKITAPPESLSQYFSNEYQCYGVSIEWNLWNVHTLREIFRKVGHGCGIGSSNQPIPVDQGVVPDQFMWLMDSTIVDRLHSSDWEPTSTVSNHPTRTKSI